MKFFAPALTVALAATVAADHSAVCQQSHPNIWTAITEFCNVPTLVVPSDYGNKGKWHKGRYAKISSDCAPKMWVPKKYCLSQFFNMCARAAKNEKVQQSFGRHGCQFWEVNGAWNIAPLGSTG